MKVNNNLDYLVGKMEKHRISTTISAKHWELLKKHTEKLETQQKALEFALESLENSSKQISTLSLEDQLRFRMIRELTHTCLIHKDYFHLLLETGNLEKVLKLTSLTKPRDT